MPRMSNNNVIGYDELKAIGERIAIVRENHSLTQEKLADKLDVSRSAVASWERGAIAPSLGSLLKISTLFKVSIDYLLCRIKCDSYDLQYIQDSTGLSQSAIKKLKSLKKYGQPVTSVSEIITDKGFDDFLEWFTRCVGMIEKVKLGKIQDTKGYELEAYRHMMNMAESIAQKNLKKIDGQGVE